MAIIFKTIKWKNFLSTGDSFTEIQLNSHSSTLIVGPNGSGKSTLLDALSFALFGKPHREINKPQLVNSINGKNCEVQIEFSVGKTEFKVVRGMKPGIFEIWQNGILINQESHSVDYQKVLEQNILKLNHKSFHQIVVLGSSSFIPFMQLPSSHRREVIEDLLDINIFTKMNGILKEKNARLRDQLTAATYDSELNEKTITVQKKYIGDLKNRSDEQFAKNVEKINGYQKEIDSLLQDNDAGEQQISTILAGVDQRKSELMKMRTKLVKYQSQIEQNISNATKDAEFYRTHDECPTCSQKIDGTLKQQKEHKCQSKLTDLNDGYSKLQTELDSLDASLQKINEAQQKAHTIELGIHKNSTRITQLQKLIKEIEKENAATQHTDLDEAEQKLADLQQKAVEFSKLKGTYYEQGAYNQAMGEMLKDTGIKTKVIKQYLPVMNRLINGYLQTLDFFVAFNLDESFEETIRSRHRDEFSYASFSEGEKQRIDLALLFTWRQIARMKNSVSTNLLVLDETFDSSMDNDGVENLMKILATIDSGTSVFIISHKTDALDGKFARKFEFGKEHNFSKLQLK